MGLVDGLHAVHGISLQSWQRHGATFIGGLLFAMVWIPPPPVAARRKYLFMLIVAALALALGLWWGSEWMPVTWYPAGLYILPVKALNLLGGLGFLAASMFFLRRYVRQPQDEDMVFACHAMIFGMASLLFGFSHTWAADWWVWHGFRLLAYAVVLVTAYEVIVTLFKRLTHINAELTNSYIALQAQIAERAKAEESMRKAEGKYRKLVHNIPDVTWTTDRNGKTVYISPNVQRIYGYTPEDIYQNPLELWFERIHPDDVKQVEEAFNRLFKENVHYDVEYRIQRKDGEWIWLHDQAISTYAENGISYVDGVFSEVTKRIETETELKNKLHELERFRKATIDREFRMKELCDEIKRLKAEKER